MDYKPILRLRAIIRVYPNLLDFFMINSSSFLPTTSAILVRELDPIHSDLIHLHLLALNPEDRRLRFGLIVSNEFIDSYVSQLNFSRDSIFGVFNQDLNILGMAHLAYPPDLSSNKTAEFGVSVSESGRGIGIGTALFKRAAIHCRNTNISILYVHCLSSNDAMMHIAKKSGMSVQNDLGETDAYLQINPGDQSSLLTEALQDQAALIDYGIKENLHNAFKFSSHILKSY